MKFASVRVVTQNLDGLIEFFIKCFPYRSRTAGRWICRNAIRRRGACDFVRASDPAL